MEGKLQVLSPGQYSPCFNIPEQSAKFVGDRRENKAFDCIAEEGDKVMKAQRGAIWLVYAEIDEGGGWITDTEGF